MTSNWKKQPLQRLSVTASHSSLVFNYCRHSQSSRPIKPVNTLVGDEFRTDTIMYFEDGHQKRLLSVKETMMFKSMFFIEAGPLADYHRLN